MVTQKIELIHPEWYLKPHRIAEDKIDSAIEKAGDYHYLEALMRYKNPDWKMYW